MVKGSVCADVNKLRNSGEVLERVNELAFAPGGTVVEMRSRVEKHVTELKSDYEGRGFHSDQINFWDAENQNTFQFEAIHMVDAGFVDGACAKSYSILAINLKKEGYRTRGEASLLTLNVSFQARARAKPSSLTLSNTSGVDIRACNRH